MALSRFKLRLGCIDDSVERNEILKSETLPSLFFVACETHSHKKISVTIESVDFEMSCHAVMVSG